MEFTKRRFVLPLTLLALMGGIVGGCSEKSDEEKAIEEIQKQFEEAMDE